MTFPLHAAGPFTNDVSIVPASFLNDMRVNFPKAVDGDGGGTYSGNLIWDGDHTFHGNTIIDAIVNDVEVSGRLVMTGDAGRLHRRIDVGTLGDANGNASVAKDIWKSTAALTGARTYTLLHTSPAAAPPVEGDVLRIVRFGTANGHVIAVKREDATTLASFAAVNVFMFLDFMFTGGVWVTAGAGGDSANTPVAV